MTFGTRGHYIVQWGEVQIARRAREGEIQIVFKRGDEEQKGRDKQFYCFSSASIWGNNSLRPSAINQ